MGLVDLRTAEVVSPKYGSLLLWPITPSGEIVRTTVGPLMSFSRRVPAASLRPAPPGHDRALEAILRSQGTDLVLPCVLPYGFVICVALSVTAVCASARPSMIVPVFIEIRVWERMIPLKLAVVPRVA